MVSIAGKARPSSRPRWHKVFLAMLPAIVTHAKFAFRHVRGEARQDFIQETIANALVAFVALVRRGKMSIAYPTVLAKYAMRPDQRRPPRGQPAQRARGAVERTPRSTRASRSSGSTASTRRRTSGAKRWCRTPAGAGAEIVSFRVDFADWLGPLPASRPPHCRVPWHSATAPATWRRSSTCAKAASASFAANWPKSWKKFVGDDDLASSMPA